MAGFNAATAVEALDYDFTKYVPGCKGVIPEPTTQQVNDYLETIRFLAKEMEKDFGVKLGKDGIEPVDRPEMSDDDAAALIEGADEVLLEKYNKRIESSLNNLTGGTPSADEVNALPYRVKAAFLAWVAEAIRPEQRGPATKH